MRSLTRRLGLFVAVVLLAGCASTKTTQQTQMADVGLARPNMIWVYDFISSPANVPSDSSLNGEYDPNSPPPSAQDAADAQKYGAMIAERLVEDIQKMGMPATNGIMGSQPQIGDGIIRGYITSTEGGGAGGTLKRMVIGFGSGQAEISTVVEGYVMTASGPMWLGSGSVNAEGNKAPGLVVPAIVTAATANPVGLIVVGGLKIAGAVSGRSGLEGRAKSTADEIAKQLKVRFQQRGWIPADS
ncbi:MAG TPA: DUF4410 domain-containing protein [Candidatus Binataceae bacterium]|nr:DUF4410 domain-containing protein [Candidatus Binataceae bacterium]